MKKLIKTNLIFILLFSILLFISCKMETTCRGSVYKGRLVEDILIVSNLDTTNIIIEQSSPHGINLRDSIHSSFTMEEDSTDLIKLKLFVSYESHTKKPNMNKESTFYQDTVFIWYSIDEKYNTTLMKNNSILESECSPTIQYSRIDSIHIEVSKNKTVKLESRYL